MAKKRSARAADVRIPSLTPEQSKALSGFINQLYWVFGTASLTWCFIALVAIARLTPIEVPVWGQASITEVILISLVVAPLLSAPACLACFVHRRYFAPPLSQSRFPGIPSDVMAVPQIFDRLRPALFVFFIILPAGFTYLCWHRMTFNCAIVWKATADDVNAKNVAALQKLLTETPEATPEQRDAVQVKIPPGDNLEGWRKFNPFGLNHSILHSDWRWHGPYIEWAEKKEHAGYDMHGNPVFKNGGYIRVQPTGWPFIMPVAATILALLHIVASLGLCIRPHRKILN